MTAKRDFYHPYQPYDIQHDFMNALFACIDQGQIGIFESPTGTGKSLSLICGSLAWLKENQEKVFEHDDESDTTSEPDWIREQAAKERHKVTTLRKIELETRLAGIRREEFRQNERHRTGEPRSKRVRPNDSISASGEDAEAQFVLDDYNSDEDGGTSLNRKADDNGGFSSKSMALMDRLGMISKPSVRSEEMQTEHDVKIFYSSRTHSQLTQFTDEVRRVKLPTLNSMSSADESRPGEVEIEQQIKHLALGSRKNLCINKDVSKLPSALAINERCLELQKPGTPNDHKCSYLPSKENESLVRSFRDHTLAKIRDIEDLADLGKDLGICPYYASRATINVSEIITLPYPLLLQRSAREALDISLKNQIVIIDEAHNLMDAISNMHSITITSHQLKRCKGNIVVYLQKFRNKLKGKNRIYVMQVVRLIDSLIACLESIATKGTAQEGPVKIGELMAGKGVDQINIYKLMHYLKESKLARKVEGYVTYKEEQDAQRNVALESSMPVLTHIQSFFGTLTNPTAEGRFFYSIHEKTVQLRYMVLDPKHHFKEIVEEARAVVLAGGTMSPMEDYIQHLFPYVASASIRTLSCGHVIPNENLIALPMAKGPNGIDFNFTYECRNLTELIDELGECLLELSQIIPDGLVVFFPSYAYMQNVVSRWEASGTQTRTVLELLSAQKPVHRELQDTSGGDDILREYSKNIDAGKGGLLLSVVGGKMSEGINFADKLGRSIIVVGLPFPNIRSTEWKAKLDYIENHAVAEGRSRGDGKSLARDFYENACMRSVNQSIGRAIRHRKDYASIILLDRRYATSRISDKLPGWIKKNLEKSHKTFGEQLEGLKAFYQVERNVML